MCEVWSNCAAVLLRSCAGVRVCCCAEERRRQRWEFLAEPWAVVLAAELDQGEVDERPITQPFHELRKE